MLETVCSAPLLDAPQSTVKISAHPSPDRGDGRPEGRNSLEGTKDLSVIMTPDFTSCLRLDKEVDGRYSTTARCPTGYEIEKGDALCFDQGERLSNGRVDETTWQASCCGYPGKIEVRCKKKLDPTVGSLTDPALTRLGGENLPPL